MHAARTNCKMDSNRLRRNITENPCTNLKITQFISHAQQTFDLSNTVSQITRLHQAQPTLLQAVTKGFSKDRRMKQLQTICHAEKHLHHGLFLSHLGPTHDEKCSTSGQLK